MKNVARPFTEEEDRFLRENHATRTGPWIAEQLGRSRSSIRNRAERLGLVGIWAQTKDDAPIAALPGGQEAAVLRLALTPPESWPAPGPDRIEILASRRYLKLPLFPWMNHARFRLPSDLPVLADARSGEDSDDE